jgi:phage shock protein A
MEMIKMELLIVLILSTVFVLWVAFSPDKLASAIRTRFIGAKARAADAMDDAVDRVEAAQANIEEQLAKANGGLIDIKTMRKAIENKLNEAKATVTKYNTAAENAASGSRQDLVAEAVSRKNVALGEQGTLQKQYDFLVAKETEVQSAVTALNTRKAQMARTKTEIKTRAKTAKVTLGVNELLAGVDLTGRQADVDRAFEIVEELEAKSGAMAEIAEVAKADQRLEAELEALSSPLVDEAAEVEALMKKFKKTDEVK